MNYFIYPGVAKVPIDSDFILKNICKLHQSYELTKEELLAENRKWELRELRQLAAYIIKKQLKLTDSQIGIILKRNHSTICQGLKKTESDLRYNNNIKEKYYALTSYIEKFGIVPGKELNVTKMEFQK